MYYEKWPVLARSPLLFLWLLLVLQPINVIGPKSIFSIDRTAKINTDRTTVNLNMIHTKYFYTHMVF